MLVGTGWGTCWRVGDGLGKWWEAGSGGSARFSWKEKVRAGGVLIRLIK